MRGGIDVPPVLGSRSTDTLSGLGPAALTAGTQLPVGGLAGEEPVVDVAPVPGPPERPPVQRAARKRTTSPGRSCAATGRSAVTTTASTG